MRDDFYSDKHSTFQNLLYQDRSVCMNSRNQLTLAINMFEVSRGSGSNIFADIFYCRLATNYSTLSHSVFIGLESIAYI